MTIWREQKTLDPEQQHSPELYVIWNEKLKFLLESISDNVFDSSYFLWTDIGSFRDKKHLQDLITFPDLMRVRQSLGEHKIFFLQIHPFSPNQTFADRGNGFLAYDFKNDVRLGGAVLGGHKSAIKTYAERYFSTMETMRQNGCFIGKDQNIMSTVALLYPDLVHLVAPKPYLNDSDPWFYSLYYFTKQVNDSVSNFRSAN